VFGSFDFFLTLL